MDSKIDLHHHRPMVPPKPDKDKISLTTTSPTLMDTGSDGSVAGSLGIKQRSSFDISTTSPSSVTEASRPPPSLNGHTPEESGQKPPPTPPRLSISSPNKPALPPKPSNNSSPRLSSSSSGTFSPPPPPPPSLTPPKVSTPSSSKISPPLLPKGRNSISIANAILSNANKSVDGSPQNKTSSISATPPQQFESSESCRTNQNVITRRNLTTRSPSAPLSPRPHTNNFNAAPRPFSNIFNFPHPPSEQQQQQSPLHRNNGNLPPLSPGLRAGKSVSLGRNVAPPVASPTSSVTQFFSNKAASLARMLPLDLNFGKSNSPSPSSAKSPSKSISSPPTMMQNYNNNNNSNNNNSPSSQFSRNTTIFNNNPIPPPPPPRLRRKLSPVSSLSPVSDSTSPNSPPVFSPSSSTPGNFTQGQIPMIAPLAVEEDPPVVIYAEIDKEKKWAARRLKNGDNDHTTTTTIISVEKVEIKEEEEEEEAGIQGSLVITINRDTDPTVVNVKSVRVKSDEVQKCKEIRSQKIIETSQSEQIASVGGNGGVSSKMCAAESVVVDSWLGKYLKDPVVTEKSPFTSIQKSIMQEQERPLPLGQDEHQIRFSTNPFKNPGFSHPKSVDQSTETTTFDEKLQVEPTLLVDNKSFLFSSLSTVGRDGGGDDSRNSQISINNEEKSSKTETQILPCETTSKEMDEPQPEKDTATAKDAFENHPNPDYLLHSVDSKIQSVVSRLSNLSGKVSPSCSNHSESPPPPPRIHEELESLSITENNDNTFTTNHKIKLVSSFQKTETSSSDIAIEDTTANLESRDELGLNLSSPSSAIVRRRSWNCSGDSSSPCESSSSSLTNLRDKHNNKKAVGLGWVDEGDSTGVLGDVDTSDAPIPNSSSTEELGSTFSLRRKKWGIFSSFGKSGGTSSTSSSPNGTQKQNKRGKDKTKSLLSETNGKIGKNISRQISGPILLNTTPPPRLNHAENEDNVDNVHTTPREKSNHSSWVQFSPDIVDIPSPHNKHHRYSEGSIGETSLLSIPQESSEQGDNESICSFSSVSTTGTGYTLNMSAGYEDILSELSPQDKKAFYVAREILTSEQTFIDVLDLLTIDFPKAIRSYEETLKHPIIPPQDLDIILAGLPNLKRVNEELQVDLQQRISNWREHPKLADVIVKKGPFLKLYAHYIKNFEKTTLKLDECCQQYPPFMKALQEFEMSDRCHKLGLKHYMLKPVQRMPQYRLLLEDYLKQLDKDGCDFEDTVTALKIVKDVADHANEAIKLQVNADKLLHLQNRLTGAIIMKADRLLLKEGELVKVCRKDLQPRFFALMNDCLMCMSYNATAGSTKDLKMRNELSLAGMKVCLSANEDYQNEFSVISTARSFNLVAKSAREREHWMKALNDAINDNIRKRSCRTPDQEEGFALGKIAPVWIQDSRVTMCQICTAEFTVTFRRHHCRSCGKVVCRHCSGNQAPLQYLKNDAERVCDECYQYLLEEFDNEARDSTNDGLETSRETIRTRFKKVTPNVSKRAQAKRNVKSRLEVPANNSGSRISGYLHWRERRAWKRRWFVLMDRVLYIYAASEDIVAIKGIPVLGWNVDFEKSEFMDGGDNEAVFKLSHLGQNTLLFQADNPALAERWINLMKEATVLT